ncbi:MAG: O-antigen ligase family protein [Candidatus Zixiibacteriota bacterium]
MTGGSSDRLDRFLFYSYLIFAVSATFSRALGQMSLGVALALFIIVVIVRREIPLRPPLAYLCSLAALYVAWLVVTGLASSTGWDSVWVTKKEWLFFALPIGYYLFQSAENRLMVIKVLAVAVAAGSLYGFVQYVTGMDWIHFDEHGLSPQAITQITGTSFSVATFANYYAAVGVFLLGLAAFGLDSWGKLKWWLFGSGLAAVVASTLTGERGPTIAIALGLILIAVWKKGLFRSLAIGAVVLIAVVSIAQPEMLERYRKIYEVESVGKHEGSRHFIWKNSLEILSTTPWVGVGNGNFMAAYREHVGPTVPPEYRHGHAHNDIINVAMAGGIPAAVLFVGLWGAVILLLVRIGRNREFSEEQKGIARAVLVALAAYLVIALIECPWAAEETHELVLFLWALGLAPWYKRSPYQLGH